MSWLDDFLRRRNVAPEDAELYRQVEFGIEVQAFLGAPIGQYLLNCIEADRKQALEALADVDPEDAKAIRTLQNTITCVDAVGRWLGNAITAGEAAQKQLEQGD